MGLSIVRSIRTTLSLSIALVALAEGSPSWARLGETEEQCEKRYRKPSLSEDLISNFGWDAKTLTLKKDKVLQYAKDGTTIYAAADVEPRPLEPSMENSL